MRFCCTQFAWLLSITCSHIALSHYEQVCVCVRIYIQICEYVCVRGLGSKCRTWISAHFMCLHSHLPYFYVNLFELGKSRHKSFRNGNFLLAFLLYFYHANRSATLNDMNHHPHRTPVPLPQPATHTLCNVQRVTSSRNPRPAEKGTPFCPHATSSRTGTAAATNIIIQSHLLCAQLPVDLCWHFECILLQDWARQHN